MLKSSVKCLCLPYKIRLRLLKEIVSAIQSYGRAHRFIREHRLLKWIIIPGIIYALVFGISMYYFGKTANNAIEFLMVSLGLDHYVQQLQSTFLGFLFTLATLILWVLLMFFYFSLFKYIWLIVGSPIFAYLSEMTEAIIERRSYPFSIRQILQDTRRGIRISLRNAGRQFLYAGLIILLSFIPLLGWGAPLLALIVECYYYGFSMLDYSFERNRIPVERSYQYIDNHKGLAIGNGMVFYLMHAIPIIGWIFAPAYAVIAATISLMEENNFSNLANKP